MYHHIGTDGRRFQPPYPCWQIPVPWAQLVDEAGLLYWRNCASGVTQRHAPPRVALHCSHLAHLGVLAVTRVPRSSCRSLALSMGSKISLILLIQNCMQRLRDLPKNVLEKKSFLNLNIYFTIILNNLQSTFRSFAFLKSEWLQPKKVP